MLVEFREQKCLCLLYRDVHGNPPLIIGMDDARAVDAKASQPFLDVGYGLLFWGKHIVNLVSTPVLAILLGVGVGPILVDC